MAHARTLFLGASVAMALCGAAWAGESAPPDPWTGIEIMSEADMADLRGGIRLPNGLDLGLGAIVTTFSNGVPALQTQLSWTDAGAVVGQTIGSLGQDITSMSDEAREALGIEDVAGGVVISDSDGVTTLVHNVTDGALQNIILNDANGRNLRQDIDLTLTLPDFDAMQASMIVQRLGMQLNADFFAAPSPGG